MFTAELRRVGKKLAGSVPENVNVSKGFRLGKFRKPIEVIVGVQWSFEAVLYLGISISSFLLLLFLSFFFLLKTFFSWY